MALIAKEQKIERTDLRIKIDQNIKRGNPQHRSETDAETPFKKNSGN